jgi:hypothetical protein
MDNQEPQEVGVKHFIYFSLLFIVFFIITCGLIFLCSCQYIPDIAKDVDDIATDTAIKIEVSRETFLKDTDLDLSVKVNNKDSKVKI